ncbi:conserved hypothetical protein [Hahella chejuensis KCTC 2396]|uniref:Uncharacterized protein n=1 Tax=Hahella chejuensis (strain KCTC 2396) TaxID=349521 RepID=Q2SGA4_HAHCH|nr:hypothetical protein [Hahella chejuensis]ABC30320.1 conserved hypothetical protein [Hahella chejuensis KCTC 2396]
MSDFWPQFCPSNWCDEYGVFGIPFTNEVSIGFVKVIESGYSYLLTSEFDGLGYNRDSLLSSSIDALGDDTSKVHMKVARPTGATVVWLEAEDNFAAVRMLLPAVQAFVKKHVGDEVLFTIPSRDLVLLWNADAPVSLTNKHRLEAQEDFKNDDYALSPDVYKFTAQWPCMAVR